MTSSLVELVECCKIEEVVHPSYEVAFPLAVAGILEVGVGEVAG